MITLYCQAELTNERMSYYFDGVLVTKVVAATFQTEVLPTAMAKWPRLLNYLELSSKTSKNVNAIARSFSTLFLFQQYFGRVTQQTTIITLFMGINRSSDKGCDLSDSIFVIFHYQLISAFSYIYFSLKLHFPH